MSLFHKNLIKELLESSLDEQAKYVDKIILGDYYDNDYVTIRAELEKPLSANDCERINKQSIGNLAFLTQKGPIDIVLLASERLDEVKKYYLENAAPK